jgi:branched-chain amino acid transport system substrate-binding protein
MFNLDNTPRHEPTEAVLTHRTELDIDVLDWEESVKRMRLVYLSVLLAGLSGLIDSREAVAAESLKLGVLTDLSSVYSDSSGNGAIYATQMAVGDLAAELKAAGIEVAVVSADHQGKPDIGANIVRQWLDRDHVDVIVNVPNSAVGLAVQAITRAQKKIFLISGAATADLTGKQCSPYSAHWTDDTYTLAHGTAVALVNQGKKNWFFLVADYAFGHAMEAAARSVVEAGGGKVLGSVRHPVGTSDMSSFLLQAQASHADVIALANGGIDTVNAIKGAHEFQIVQGGQSLVGMGLFITDVHSLGLDVAQGLYLTTGFYWDRNDESRAWSKRFFAKMNMMPTREHAETYSAVRHYLRALLAENTKDADKVMARMKATPVDDFYTHDGVLRADGRLIHSVNVAQVKTPAESKYPWDYYKMVAAIGPDKAFRPLAEGGCDFVAH